MCEVPTPIIASWDNTWFRKQISAIKCAKFLAELKLEGNQMQLHRFNGLSVYTKYIMSYH